MHEAINYNALSWIRQELGETIKQARLLLEEYAADPTNEAPLHHCVKQLHEALGPLKMVDIRGAVLLVTEMEEVVADLQQGILVQADSAMEQLMQAFLVLPDYLSSIQPAGRENPDILLHLINDLRATRGAQLLQQKDIFSPNLSVRVPISVFDVRAEPAIQDVSSMARAARVRFQSGLLEWYRDADGNAGLQILIDVLEHLQHCAASEPAARIWWVGAGVAEALRDGMLETTPETKQLFGQLDRQIKRLLDAGEAVFDDVLSDDLMKSLLFRIAQATSVSDRIRLIRETYEIKQLAAISGATESASDGLVSCNEELMGTVAVTVCSDINRIKENLEDYKKHNDDAQCYIPIADEMHALSNTLGMIQRGVHAEAVAERERELREAIHCNTTPEESWFVLVANTLVSVEDALDDFAAENPEGSILIQGFSAVMQEVLSCIVTAKDAISDFMKSSDNVEHLSAVPGLLNQVCGSLRLTGLDRAAAAADQVRLFILQELIERQQTPFEDQLDYLADAICSIEFYVEEAAVNHKYAGAALDVAEKSLAKLGYTCAIVDELCCSSGASDIAEQSVPVLVAGENAEGDSETETIDCGQQDADVDDVLEITGLQTIAPDVDEEILEIFIEEADEELQKLTALIPVWTATGDEKEYLVDIRRSFHTLKGSGRMVGALAVGEFAWAIENLVNKVLDDTLEPHDAIKSVLYDSVSGLEQLLRQVKDGVIRHEVDVNDIARRALHYSDPCVTTTGWASAEVDEDVVAPATEEQQTEHISRADNEAVEISQSNPQPSVEFPVLSSEADSEIVEIFLEEAADEITNLATAIPAWLDQAVVNDVLADIRRSFHTLKGSGRMAGAMLIGEFSWCLENLLNKVMDETVSVTEPLRTFLAKVPGALSQLLVQVRGDGDPVIDIAYMMQEAAALSRGEAFDTELLDEITDSTDADEVLAEVVVEQYAEDIPVDNVEDEASLLEIFSAECRVHLQAIEEFTEENDGSCVVSDSLYRALHTLSGISESAEIVSIRDLAGHLNDYFSEYYHTQHLVNKNAVDVLRACTSELAAAAQQLPDLVFDEENRKVLHDQIAALPRAGEQTGEQDVVSSIPGPVESELNVSAVDHVEAVDTVIAAEPEPFSDMDPELYEIFVEEASEIIDSSEVTLRAWSEEPQNNEYMTEFQRQLHTLKGSARMVDIQAIGDLSHVLESLITRIADGLIATSDELFALMQESQDHLSEMLEQVKVRQMPAGATQLQTRLDALWETGTVTVSQDDGETAAVVGHETASENDHLSGTLPLDGDVQLVEVVQAIEAVQAEETVQATEAVQAEETVQEEESVPVEAPLQDEDVALMPTMDGADASGCDTQSVHELNAEIELSVPKHLSLPQKKEQQQVRVHGEQVRVQSTLLDDMVNYAGEINIYRSRMEQQVSDYRYNLAELDQTITRLRDQLRQLEMETEAQILYRYEQEVDASNQEFDPLEMDRYSNLQQASRSLIESISDLRSLQELMENTTRESETLLLQQSRVSTDLQEGLMRSRMIPFSGLASRLRRIVRQSARQLEKKVDLELFGADGEMDRTVIDRVIAPLEHMLRNAVAHGIELPEQRKAVGKKVEGLITISFDREGPEIVLHIEDDGAGLNTEAIRARALEQGLIAEGTELSDDDVMQFILQTGFSTATEVTQISGRGVGMDVVNSEVKQLGGSLHIESKAGQGTIFTVRLPYTLAINQALLVMAGNETFCVPLASIEGVVRANCEELRACYRADDCLYYYAGNEYQLKHLGSLLNTTTPACVIQKQVPVLLVRIGEKRIAIQVEALMGSREIVIKPVGAQLSTVDCISGATILGDGRVVMILDMAAVARMNVRARLPEVQVETDQESRLVIMVVDDSITVRKVTSRLLERNGFRILTAKDGVDAMGQLQDVVPDMMLLDIEMPRMDGFELATHMRNDTRLKHVPIIMITSRTGDKHRERAQQIGVNDYLGKPYQEGDLLNSIHHIIGVPAAGEVA